MTELFAALLVLCGAGFCLIASLGIVRLPDVYNRMHASTKAGTLGCGLILAAVAVFFLQTDVAVRALGTVVFLILTAPVAAHMISRAAYRTGVPLCRGSVVDEMARERTEEGKPPAGT